jgi:hypothetical protein
MIKTQTQTSDIEKISYALDNVAYHRAAIMQMPPLHWPQIEAIALIEKRIAEKQGGYITVRAARQTMKNECSAMVQCRMLTKYMFDGGSYIRTAPTWKPQIVTSRVRLERMIRHDPLCQGAKHRFGYTVERGDARVVFLSSDKNSSIVGDTASIALDLDEAHKVDAGKFDEDFAPMVAHYSSPVIMWGVAADENDLLYEYRQKNFNELNNPKNNLQYPASIWCELIPAYAKHYEERVKVLGPDHPIIKTQYDLIDIKALGGFLNQHQIAIMLNSDHERYAAPKPGCEYVCLIDIAGEAEEEEQDPMKKSEGSRDSTVALVFEVERNKKINGYPQCRLVQLYWWTGKSLADGPSELPGQQSTLAAFLSLWHPTTTVIDARGVGEQVAGYLARKIGGVNEYKADLSSVSDDCYKALAFVNNGCIKTFRNDSSVEYRELTRQLEHTKYQIVQHDKMKITKPKSNLHIDMVKALTYLPRAVMQGEPGIFVL